MKKNVKSLVTGVLSEVVVTHSKSKGFGATSVRIFVFLAKYWVLFYFLVKAFTTIPLVQGSLGVNLCFLIQVDILIAVISIKYLCQQKILRYEMVGNFIWLGRVENDQSLMKRT